MEELFELMTTKEERDGNLTVRLGIRLKVAGHETVCPIIRQCETYEAFEEASQALLERLDKVRHKARSLFRSLSPESGMSIGPDTPAEKIWEALSMIADEAAWVASFNELSAEQREAVAEHVLTHCNIFSGKAAFFSRRYDSETGLM